MPNELPRTAMRGLRDHIADLDWAAADSAVDNDIDFRRIQDAQFTGTVSAIRGDYMDVSATNSDGRTRVIRNVRANDGYRRMAVGDAVSVSRLSDGRNIADGLPNSGIGGRSSAFWARVTQRFTAIRKDANGDDQTYTTRAYVNPLKAADGGELLAYTTSATVSVEVGMEVEVTRDDGGLTDDSRDGYAELYLITNSRLPSDWYDRAEGRPQEAYTVYADGLSVGTAKPNEAAAARRLVLRFIEDRGGVLPGSTWWESTDITRKPDGNFSPRIYQPQYWRTGAQNSLDDSPVACEVIVDTLTRMDSVSVQGGFKIETNPTKTDMERVSELRPIAFAGLPETERAAAYRAALAAWVDNNGAGRKPILDDFAGIPAGAARTRAFSAATAAWDNSPTVKWHRWTFTGMTARSVSIFDIFITSGDTVNKAQYTLVLEKNRVYP